MILLNYVIDYNDPDLDPIFPLLKGQHNSELKSNNLLRSTDGSLGSCLMQISISSKRNLTYPWHTKTFYIFVLTSRPILAPLMAASFKVSDMYTLVDS